MSHASLRGERKQCGGVRWLLDRQLCCDIFIVVVRPFMTHRLRCYHIRWKFYLKAFGLSHRGILPLLCPMFCLEVAAVMSGALARQSGSSSPRCHFSRCETFCDSQKFVAIRCDSLENFT